VLLNFIPFYAVKHAGEGVHAKIAFTEKWLISLLQIEIVRYVFQNARVNHDCDAIIFVLQSLSCIDFLKNVLLQSGFFDISQKRHETKNESTKNQHIAQESFYVL